MDLLPAVSPEIAAAVSGVGRADVMLAIPAYNNEQTISRVMKVAAEGLSTFFADKRCVLFVCEDHPWAGRPQRHDPSNQTTAK